MLKTRSRQGCRHRCDQHDCQGDDVPDHRDDQDGYKARNQIVDVNLQSTPRDLLQQPIDALAGQDSRVDYSTRDAGQKDR